MKIIGISSQANWDRRYLIEASAQELATVSGDPYGSRSLEIGAEIAPAKVYEHLRSFAAMPKEIESAAKGLGGMAEGLRALAAIIDSAKARETSEVQS